MKAGKVAGKYDTAVGGDSLRRSQMYQQCQEQALSFRRRISGVLSVSGGIDSVSDVTAQINALLP